MKAVFLSLAMIVALFIIFSPKLFSQTKATIDGVKSASLAWDPYGDYPVYTGTDLGVTYSPAASILRVWSPPAEMMKLKLYRSSTGDDLREEVNCLKGANGVWKAELKGDRKGTFYTFQAKVNGRWLEEHPDPYAKAVGTNGKRGQIIDFKETNPKGWESDKAPVLKNPTDAVIYELHVRDLSIAENSGITQKGKFLGLTESGTTNSHGQKTGIDHMAELGITHIHLLPVFDYSSVDESTPDVPQFNWGYDPLNFNVPEGSYSTVPADGKVRISEFKKMVQALHSKGIRVVMDVVYNHTGPTQNSNFNQLVPGYYYRQWEKDNSFSNASGCGNETASDRYMVRKFIVESVCWWAKEYHIDGFRFDLMAIHDIETMNAVSAALHAIDPSILIYGEGWTAGDSPLPEKHRALKAHAKQLEGIAVFSDDIRDAIKGSVFEDKSTGFASGAANTLESVKFGIVAAGNHPQIDFAKVNYSKAPYTNAPSQVINYVSCHDNHTLYDKLKVSRPNASEEDIIRMHKLANTIVFTSQGIPFLHAGVEIKRTKGGEHNSFNKPDSVNRINWEWKQTNAGLFDYYKDLVTFRKDHPAFRMPTHEMVAQHLEFLPSDDQHLIAYRLKDHANGDMWAQILVIFNGSGQSKMFHIPDGNWMIALKDQEFVKNTKPVSGMVRLSPYSATILFQD